MDFDQVIDKRRRELVVNQLQRLSKDARVDIDVLEQIPEHSEIHFAIKTYYEKGLNQRKLRADATVGDLIEFLES